MQAIPRPAPRDAPATTATCPSSGFLGGMAPSGSDDRLIVNDDSLTLQNERSFTICQAMTPRPRTVADEDILAATSRAIGRLGPARFTLADVAADVGLSPATLLQRFGSKRGLLLALAGSAVAYVDAGFAMIRAAHPSYVEALLVAGTHMASMVQSPEELANHHAFVYENHTKILAGYRALLDDAVAAGELDVADSAAVARAVSAISGGAL